MIFFNSRRSLTAEVLDGVLVVGLGGVQTKLAVEVLPGEALRSAEREGAIGEPQVEIEAQGAALEGREGVHVQRHRMADNLVEESPTRFNLAVSESLVCPFPLRRSFVGMMIYNDIK